MCNVFKSKAQLESFFYVLHVQFTFALTVCNVSVALGIRAMCGQMAEEALTQYSPMLILTMYSAGARTDHTCNLR